MMMTCMIISISKRRTGRSFRTNAELDRHVQQKRQEATRYVQQQYDDIMANFGSRVVKLRKKRKEVANPAGPDLEKYLAAQFNAERPYGQAIQPTRR
jgi:predicted membrane metal-binding protein